jgi:hypothetical protein
MSHHNLVTGAYVALAALSVAAIWAAGRTKNITRNSRWSVPAVAAIGLTLVTPLMWSAAATSMVYLSASDSGLEQATPLFAFVPAVLVYIAAIRCARVAPRQARRGHGLAVTAMAFTHSAGLLLAAGCTYMFLPSQRGT